MDDEGLRRVVGRIFVKKRQSLLRPPDSGAPKSRHGYHTRARQRRQAYKSQEEIAGEAGVSVSVIRHLEQGATTALSAELLLHLCNTYRLSDLEIRTVFSLRGRPVPIWSRDVAPAVPHWLKSFFLEHWHQPACIIDACLDIRAWNPACDLVFGTSLSALRDQERNGLLLVFEPGVGDSKPRAQRFIANWQEHGRQLVEEFRAAAKLQPHVERFDVIVNHLKTTSPEFVEMWNSTEDVGLPRTRSKKLNHLAGRGLVLVQRVLVDPETDLRLVLHEPLDNESESKLQRVMVRAFNASRARHQVETTNIGGLTVAKGAIPSDVSISKLIEHLPK